VPTSCRNKSTNIWTSLGSLCCANKAKQQLHFQILSKIELVFLFLKQTTEHTDLNPVGCGKPLLQEK